MSVVIRIRFNCHDGKNLLESNHFAEDNQSNKVKAARNA